MHIISFLKRVAVEASRVVWGAIQVAGVLIGVATACVLFVIHVVTPNNLVHLGYFSTAFLVGLGLWQVGAWLRKCWRETRPEKPGNCPQCDKDKL